MKKDDVLYIPHLNRLCLVISGSISAPTVLIAGHQMPCTVSVNDLKALTPDDLKDLKR